MQLLLVLLTGFALALLERGHELPAATAALLALFVMLFALASEPIGY